MRVWLVCFGVLFALVELYQWATQLTLPVPAYILGGVFLAIASNYNKQGGWPWSNSVDELPPVVPANPPDLTPSISAPQPLQAKE